MEKGTPTNLIMTGGYGPVVKNGSLTHADDNKFIIVAKAEKEAI